MIYLYGLFEGTHVDLSAALADVRGLQNPTKICAIDDWFLVYSAHDNAEILPKRRYMLAHTQVLERMITAGTVLPARFGLVAETLTGANDLIMAQRAPVAAAFDRVRGHVELGLRVSFPRDAALDATLAGNTALQSERVALIGKGPEVHFAIAEFGGRLADQMDRRRGLAQRTLLNALVPLAADHVLRKPEEDTEVLRAEFLVQMAAQDDFIAALEDAVASLDFAPGAAPQIQVIGPAPMYNFVQLSLTLDENEAAA